MSETSQALDEHGRRSQHDDETDKSDHPRRGEGAEQGHQADEEPEGRTLGVARGIPGVGRYAQRAPKALLLL